MDVISIKIKQKAIAFQKEHRFSLLTAHTLKKIVQSHGYTLVLYNPISNTPEVEMLLEELDVLAFSKTVKAFTCLGNHLRIVFLTEGLSEQEEKILLLHELAHIYLEHLSQKCLFGQDVQQEHEANEFVHYVLHPSLMQRWRASLYRHPKTVGIVTTLALGFGALFAIATWQNPVELISSQQYYALPSGKKFHIEHCIYIKGKSNILELTEEELKKLGYQPCKVCLPQ